MPRRTLYPHHIVPSDDVPTRVLLCLAIATGTAAFFWAYDAMAHREAPFVPSISFAQTGRNLSSTGEAPVPDRRSGARLFSNPDVQPVRLGAPDSAPASSGMPHPKVAQDVKTIPLEAANSYASGAVYPRRAIGAPE